MFISCCMHTPAQYPALSVSPNFPFFRPLPEPPASFHFPFSSSATMSQSAVDLSSAEAYALASATGRAQILAEQHSSQSQQGMTQALMQTQIKIMEARETAAASGRPVDSLLALVEQERKLAAALRDSHHRHSAEAQKLLLRSDLLALDLADVSCVAASTGERSSVVLEVSEKERTEIAQRLKQRIGAQTSSYAQQLPAHESAKSASDEKSSALDQEELVLEKLLQHAFDSRGPNGVTQLAWEWLARQPLSQPQLQQFLRQQSAPILSNIVDLVLKDLTTPCPTTHPPLTAGAAPTVRPSTPSSAMRPSIAH
jgi:hypothetical protein